MAEETNPEQQPVKKASTKKAAAKKTRGKKASAKKTTAKKATVKKARAKKAAAKKAVHTPVTEQGQTPETQPTPPQQLHESFALNAKKSQKYRFIWLAIVALVVLYLIFQVIS